MMKEKSAKLKPCPFCGGEAEIKKCGIICDEAYVVVCKECKVRTRMEFINRPKIDEEKTEKTAEDFEKDAMKAAADKWNRRVHND